MQQKKPKNTWSVLITDNGRTIVNPPPKTLQYVPDQEAAEWIVEAHPVGLNGPNTGMPLPDFGSVSFTNASAGVNFKTPSSAGSFNTTPIAMVNDENNPTITYTILSNLTTGGSFTDSYNFQIVGGGFSTPSIIGTAFLWQDLVFANLGTLPGGASVGAASSATGINGQGQIVGVSPCGPPSCPAVTDQSAFLWQNGSMTALATLPASCSPASSEATAINGQGQIVGWSTLLDATNTCALFHAVLWQNGTITDLGTLCPSNPSYANYSNPVAINANGQVVGVSNICVSTNLPVTHVTLWQDGSAPIDLGCAYGCATSFNPTSINDLGQIAGAVYTNSGTTKHAAILLQNGNITDLGTLPGGTNSVANSINNLGQVTGGSDSHAVVWENSIAPVQIIDLGIPFGAQCSGTSIDSQGRVVGECFDYSTSPLGHAFLWESGVFFDLGTNWVFQSF
jgi:probable HAF family extracellular repeat protein